MDNSMHTNVLESYTVEKYMETYNMTESGILSFFGCKVNKVEELIGIVQYYDNCEVTFGILANGNVVVSLDNGSGGSSVYVKTYIEFLHDNVFTSTL